MGAKKLPNSIKTNLDHKEVLKHNKVDLNIDTKNPYNTDIVIDRQTSEKYIKLGKKILNKKEKSDQNFQKEFSEQTRILARLLSAKSFFIFSTIIFLFNLGTGFFTNYSLNKKISNLKNNPACNENKSKIAQILQNVESRKINFGPILREITNLRTHFKRDRAPAHCKEKTLTNTKK